MTVQPVTLARRADRRGLPYAEVSVRVTGEAAIALLEQLAAEAGKWPGQLAADLVLEELWYIGTPGMREHVRARRLARRDAHDPGRDKR